MPLWAAIVLFFICVILSIISFRAYFRSGSRRNDRKVILASFVVLPFLIGAALLYAATVLLLVSAVD